MRAQGLCNGKIVSQVVIQRSARTIMDKAHAPRWSRAVLQPLLVGVPTRESAIRPFLQLADGEPCTEQRRAESERLLRLQPYLADATVTAVEESDGRVRIEIETIDDLRPIIGLGLHGARPTNAEIGNSNIAGTGHLAAVSWRDGRAFRDGFGFRYADYHLLGRPAVANLALVRQPLGSFVLASLARPFYTDLQHSAAYVGYLRDDGYVRFLRPRADALSLGTVRERADMGAAFRLGIYGSTKVLLGALASFERRTTSTRPVIISDSGFVSIMDSTLRNRYRTTDATRLGIVTGVRALTFVKVQGFDALEGFQDIGRGMQLATTVGSTVRGTQKGPFVTSDFYAGVGDVQSFVGLRTQIESRRNDGGWSNVVGSGRIAWYSRPNDRQTRLWSLNTSARGVKTCRMSSRLMIHKVVFAATMVRISPAGNCSYYVRSDGACCPVCRRI